MANTCKNTITVIGAQEAPEAFVKKLSLAMFDIDLDNPRLELWGLADSGIDSQTWYCSLSDEYRQKGYARYGVLYVQRPYENLGLSAPRFYLEAKWKTPIEEIGQASKAFPELTFHVRWWVEPDGPFGEYVMTDGNVVEQIYRAGSWYLFDQPLIYPTISLLPAHMPYRLAQYGALRVEDAIGAIEGLRVILGDSRFTGSPYQACRERAKLIQTTQTLDRLLAQMKHAAKQLDFEGVFIDDSQRDEALKAEIAETERLAKTLGLDFILPSKGAAVRFAILPGVAATTSDPDRYIVPVLRYTNADAVSGKYTNPPDGSSLQIEWVIQVLCLSQWNVSQIMRLPDEDQGLHDVDIVMTCPEGRPFACAFNRVSPRARWRANSELANAIEEAAAEAADAFRAKLTGKAGVTLFQEFQNPCGKNRGF
jgi:hypothetical protein